MAIWMELRCDNRGNNVEGCWSHTNDGPMELTENDAKSVASERTFLIKDGILRGWKRAGKQIHCPVCASTASPNATSKGTSHERT